MSLTRFQESYGLRFFLSLITLILFVITALVSLRIVVFLTKDIESAGGTPGLSSLSQATSTASPITGPQQEPLVSNSLKKEQESTRKVPNTSMESSIWAYAKK
jgi:hypothetical protein